MSNAQYHIYGKHASIAALKNPNRNILMVYCTERTLQEHHKLISKFQYKLVGGKELANLTNNATHQDIVIKTTNICYTYLRDIDFSDLNHKIAILDQVTDVHNVGAIIRSAAFFGVATVIVQNDNSPQENGVMAKIASGGLEAINFCRVPNISQAIKHLKEIGFWVVGLDIDGETKIDKKILHGKLAFVLGAEGLGMRKLTKENCDLLYCINGNTEVVDSLNVSNAAAVAFSLMREYLSEET